MGSQAKVLAIQLHYSMSRHHPAEGLWGTLGMSCRDTIHLICWYLEGKLSASVAGEIKKHLDSCADCHMVLAAAVSTLDHYFTPAKSGEAEPANQAA